jgi:polyisoprenoid-binding protein YceI
MVKTRSFFAVAIAFALVVAVSARAQRLAVPSSGPETVTFNDKVGHNQFIWVSDAPLESIKGSSEGVTGTLTIDPQDLSKLRGTVETKTATMKTGNATRDNHLLSAEWMDVRRFPAISFSISGMKDVKTTGNSATGTALGTFTMHGVTKTLSVPFKMTYIPESDKTRQRAPGDLVMINADFTISLKDFNIAGTEGNVGSKVGETIKISAQLFGNAVKKSTT